MHLLASRAGHGIPIAGGGLVLLAAELIVSGGSALAAVGDITEYSVPTTVNTSPVSIAAGPGRKSVVH